MTRTTHALRSSSETEVGGTNFEQPERGVSHCLFLPEAAASLARLDAHAAADADVDYVPLPLPRSALFTPVDDGSSNSGFGCGRPSRSNSKGKASTSTTSAKKQRAAGVQATRLS